MRCARASTRAGFTLAEVAITVLIVGWALVGLLQGLNTAKMQAAHTRNLKLSSELANLTLGRVAAGLFQEELDVDAYLDGDFNDEGYPEFYWEMQLGEEALPDVDEDPYERDRFDTFAWDEEDDDDDEETEKPFEKVTVRVTFPAMREFSNQLTLVRWIPWTQVYGEEEE